MAGDTLGYLSIIAVFFGIPILLVLYAIFVALTRGIEPEPRQWLVEKESGQRREQGPGEQVVPGEKKKEAA